MPNAENDARCSCGNRFDGDNLCMVSVCQWEGLEDQRPSVEKDAGCQSVSEVKPFGSDAPLRCLLVSPHPLYRHYAAHPGEPDRFWTWDDKHPTYPCPSVDCPGDGRYAAPGRGHYDGCCHRGSVLPPGERVPEMLARIAEEEAHADDTDRPHYRNRVTPKGDA